MGLRARGRPAPLALCLHGFPDTPRTFRHLLPALAGQGSRAVAPTLRGYEPSTLGMAGGVHLDALAGDVLGWMDDLGAHRAHLVGHDWGALVAHAVAATAPERVASWAALAVPPAFALPGGFVAHPSQLRRSWYVGLFQVGGLAERAVRRDGFALVERLWRDWSPGLAADAQALQAVREAFSEPGVLEAALGYYRALLRPWTRRCRRVTALLLRRPVRVPTLAITGADDGCIDTRLFDRLRPADFPPDGLRVERIDGAGHFVQPERPAQVADALASWLRAHEG